MTYLARRGSSYLLRDEHLIFHGCVPVDDSGAFLSMMIDGDACAGRALFEALDAVVHRAFRERRAEDLDVLWYMWAGPISPMFGKGKMSTFETYLVADRSLHREPKNPYYRLINSSAFCRRVLDEFGVDPQRGMIVNGHVRVMEGEQPLKESGQAMAIDGGFCESYGDRGYTLILDSSGTELAEHHHFESVASALTRGADICPTIQTIRRYRAPRRVADTEAGSLIQSRIVALKRLIIAYGENALREQPLQAGSSRAMAMVI
jgi:fructose-1,6-bisphosphatase-3